MAIKVHCFKTEDNQDYGIVVDGIVAVKMPCAAAAKLPGLAQALLAATQEWALERDDELEALANGPRKPMSIEEIVKATSGMSPLLRGK